MSEYFRVLRRLEREQSGSAPQRSLTVAQRTRNQPSAPIEITDELPKAATRVAEASPAAAAAFAMLYDNLRSLRGGRSLRNLVFAPASPAESVRTVTTGLAAHLERLGLVVLIAQLSEWHARPILRLCEEQGGKTVSAGDPLPLDLHGSGDLAEVSEWLQNTAGEASLVLIEGQPLSESIDSALLARACDGLVIVAETLVTPRPALHLAAERARMAGCNILGIAMYGSNDRMPAWLRNLTTPSPSTPSRNV